MAGQSPYPEFISNIYHISRNSLAVAMLLQWYFAEMLGAGQQNSRKTTSGKPLWNGHEKPFYTAFSQMES